MTPTSHSAWRARGRSLAGALLITPARILFLIGVFWPPFYAGKNGMRLSLRVCLMLAAASWIFEIIRVTFRLG